MNEISQNKFENCIKTPRTPNPNDQTQPNLFVFYLIDASSPKKKWEHTENWLVPYAKSKKRFTMHVKIYFAMPIHIYLPTCTITYISKYTHTHTLQHRHRHRHERTYHRYVICMFWNASATGYRSSLIFCTFYHEAIRFRVKW